MKNPTAKILSIGSAILSTMAIATFQIHAGSCTPPPSGLVSLWPGEGNPKDIIGGNNGTLVGDTDYANGEVEQAFSFDGNGDGVQVSSATNLQVQDFTIETWIKRSSSSVISYGSGGNATIFGYGTGAYNFFINASGNLIFSQEGNFDYVSGPSITDTNWHHVAMTKAGGTIVFYLDGVAYTTPPYDVTLTFTGGPPGIGFWGENHDNSFLGALDELSFYNRALSTSEIQAIYNAGSEGKCMSPCTPPPSNIISWWPAEGNANDIVGSNSGMPVGPVSYTNGEVGQAFSFDGASSYVLITNSTSLNPPGAFSIEGWIYLTNDVPQSMILSKWGDRDDYGDNRSYALSTISGLGLLFSISDLANQENGAFQQITINGVLTLNSWTHVAATYDSTTGIRNLYVNGTNVLSNTNISVAVYASITPVTIGAWLRGSGDVEDYFPGLIDEVSLYGRALSGSEIQAIYNAGIAGKCPDNCIPPPSGLVGWWTGDETAMDVLNTNNGTLVGGTAYAPGEVGHAFQFSAGGDQVSVPTSGFPVGTNDRTIECWVYINSFIPGEGADFAFYGTSGIDGGSYTVGAYSDQRLFFSQWGSGIFGPVLTTNQWYHVAVTSEGTNTTLYLNGTNVASGYVPFNTPAGTQLFMGGIYYPSATYQMIGLIDEVSIYNRALSSNEIAAIYDAGSGGKCNSHPFIPPPRTATATAEWAGAFVVAVDIVDGGTGYTNTPNVRFIGGGGTGAQASVTVSNGVVVAVDITNPGSGYTNTPIVVIDPPFISNPVLGIASISTLNFNNLLVGTNYQLQFLSTTWVNQSASFTATNNFYTTMVSGVASSDSYRLAQIPVPIQATAFAQVDHGFVVNVLVNNPGSGYVVAPTVAIIANVGSNATAVASISNGRVTSIAVTSAGIHYVNPVTVLIDPPPVTALPPAVTSGVVINSSSLAPYDNYQSQFRPDFGTPWGNLSGGLFSPPATTNVQYIFLTNNTGFFRLQYVP